MREWVLRIIYTNQRLHRDCYLSPALAPPAKSLCSSTALHPIAIQRQQLLSTCQAQAPTSDSITHRWRPALSLNSTETAYDDSCLTVVLCHGCGCLWLYCYEPLCSFPSSYSSDLAGAPLDTHGSTVSHPSHISTLAFLPLLGCLPMSAPWLSARCFVWLLRTTFLP